MHAMEPLGAEIEVWPSTVEDKKSRAHNHHISLKERLKEFQNRIEQETHPKAARDHVHETTKAAAWAVFNHHGGGGVGNSPTLGSAVRRPTRFKIEAQMKHEIAHRSSVSESVAASWDAGSTLFDSFELDALLKTLDEAANPAGDSSQVEADSSEPGAIVVYSQKHWLSRPGKPNPQRTGNARLHNQRSFPLTQKSLQDDGRLVTLDETRPLQTGERELEQRAVSYKLASNLTLDELYEQAQKEAENDPFAAFSHTPSPFNVKKNFRRSFDSSFQDKSGKGASGSALNRSKWKSLLHTLHLDSASGLFHRFQGFHAQVAPHDSQRKLEQQRGSTHRPSRSMIVESKSDLLGDSLRQTQSKQNRNHPATDSADERFDPRFDPNNLHISKDVHLVPEKPIESKDDRQRNNFWKSGFKAVLSRPFGRQSSAVAESEQPLIQKPVVVPRKPDNPQSRKTDLHSSSRQQKKTGDHVQSARVKKADLQSAWQKKSDLQSAWTSFMSRSKDEDQGRQRTAARTLKNRTGHGQQSELGVSHHEIHHHHHHHHHHVAPGEEEDFELTVQAISKRVSRSSFEEKLSRRFSVEDDGIKAPRNSLNTPRNSFDPSSAYEDPVRVRLTPWEAEKGYTKGSYVH